MKRVYFALPAVLFCLCLAPFARLCEASTHAVIANHNSDIVSTIRVGDLVVSETESLFPAPLTGLAFGVAITRNGYAYVTDPGPNAAVYVLDLFESQPVHTIDTTGKRPSGIAASPNGRFVYVIDSMDGDMYVIDTADPLTFLPSSIPLGSIPAGVAVSPDSRHVYVVNFNCLSPPQCPENGSMYAVSASSGTVEWTVDNLGKGSIGVAVSPDGHNVYVTNSGDDTVSVIDTITKSEETGLFSRIKVGAAPTGLAVSPDGQFIYVANSSEDTVSVIRTSDDVLDYEVEDVDVGVAPVGVAVTPDGAKVFVTNQGDEITSEYGSVSVIYTSDYHVETLLEAENGPASFGQFIGSISVPEVPSDLQATANSETEISLSWKDNSSDEVGFSIGRRTQSDETYQEIDVVDANANTYTDTELSEGTAYGYRVRAYNIFGNSDVSDPAIATTYPAAPSDLAVEAVSDSQVSLSWTDNSDGELGYRIGRSKDPSKSYKQIGKVVPNKTTFSDSDFDEATVYYYQVMAYNSSGNSSPCTENSTTTCPAAPSDLALQVVSDSGISLTWKDNSQGESGYKINRKKASDDYEQIAVVGSNVTNYSDSGLSEATTYSYQVSAFSDSCDSSPTDESTAKTDPTAPSDLTATAIPTNRVNLTWKDNSTLTQGFIVQRKPASDGADYETVDTIEYPDDDTTYTDSGLNESTTYTYRVWAFVDGLSALDLQTKSNHSNEVSVTTPLGAPSNLSASSSKGQTVLTWKDNSSVETGFDIERKTVSEDNFGLASDNNSNADSGTFVSIATVGANVTTYTDDDVDSGTDYVYRVKALNGSETSDYSNEAQLESSSSTSCFIETAAAAHPWSMKW